MNDQLLNYMQRVGPTYSFVNGKQTNHDCKIDELVLLDCYTSEENDYCRKEWICEKCQQRFITEEKLCGCIKGEVDYEQQNNEIDG